MNHDRFMRLAIEEAKLGDWPYGALLVRENVIIAKAFNTTVRDNDTTAHAEVNVIRKALQTIPHLSLQGCTLYTTGEPCPMCTGAIIWSGVSRIVFSASIPQLMVAGHPQINTPSADIIRTGLQPIETIGGVLVEETLVMIKNHH